MICKYCGSRLKPGETVCRKCGKQQDSMVQMERFNDEMYTAQIPYGESGNGTDGPESRIIQSCMFPEQEWNMLFHSVREEQKRSRSFRRKMFVCFFIVIIINIVLLLSCIRLNLRLNSTEQSVQDYRSAWEEQTEKDEQEEAERLRQEEEEKRQQELEDQESQQNWDGGNEQDGEQFGYVVLLRNVHRGEARGARAGGLEERGVQLAEKVEILQRVPVFCQKEQGGADHKKEDRHQDNDGAVQAQVRGLAPV